jgi:hypothetical protein
MFAAVRERPRFSHVSLRILAGARLDVLAEKYLTVIDGSAEEAMVEQQSKSARRNTWESAAPSRVKYEHAFAESLKGATDTLIDMAAVSAGARVLDVACGGGSQTIEVAKRAGPTASSWLMTSLQPCWDRVRQKQPGKAPGPSKRLNAPPRTRAFGNCFQGPSRPPSSSRARVD